MRQRKPLVVANWKMNGNSDLVQQMSEALSVLNQPLPDILICPPVIFLSHFPKHANYKLGAQNMSEQLVGAFTGEISADMLRAAGASHVIIGHSEDLRIPRMAAPLCRTQPQMPLRNMPHCHCNLTDPGTDTEIVQF